MSVFVRCLFLVLALCVTQLVLSLSPPIGACQYGVDVSVPVSQQQFECIMQTYNVQNVVVRIYRSKCEIDSNAIQTLSNAYAAGYPSVDVYLFPSLDPNCTTTPAEQVEESIQVLKQNQLQINRFWFDIEIFEWSPSCTSNLAWLSAASRHALHHLGPKRVGIYTSHRSWSNITCDSQEYSKLPLWYAHYDNQTNYNDFVSFGGWTQPFAKQYAGDVNLCGVDVDMDYRQDGEC